ncbi:hypothetical protein GQX74_012035 [Glossina fuscipes]|nr:hypothetical protein GQX74_012035 [Glossina fuscipes]
MLPSITRSAILIVANQDSGCVYLIKNSEMGHNLDSQLTDPVVLPKFGFGFRMITVAVNMLAVLTFIQPNRDRRKYLFPCILWNFYMLTAIAENILEIAWSMLKMDIPFTVFATINIVGVFMLAFQNCLCDLSEDHVSDFGNKVQTITQCKHLLTHSLVSRKVFDYNETHIDEHCKI